jgi:hypothetical protein
MSRLTWLWCATREDRRAVTALDYGLIAALIAIFIVGAISTFGDSQAPVSVKAVAARIS